MWEHLDPIVFSAQCVCDAVITGFMLLDVLLITIIMGSKMVLRSCALEKSGHFYVKIDENYNSVNKHGDVCGFWFNTGPGTGFPGKPPSKVNTTASKHRF